MTEPATLKATVSTQVDDIEELEAWRELNRKIARAVCMRIVDRALEIAMEEKERKKK